jgi:hypothetical protein
MMNKWLKIGVPILIAVLLITATVGITLAVTGKGVVGQSVAPASLTGQETATELARGSQCANCPMSGQGSGTGGQDNSTGSVNVPKGATCPSSTGSVYVPKGATCPSCPGYIAGTGGQPAVTSRGGCCSGR